MESAPTEAKAGVFHMSPAGRSSCSFPEGVKARIICRAQHIRRQRRRAVILIPAALLAPFTFDGKNGTIEDAPSWAERQNVL